MAERTVKLPLVKLEVPRPAAWDLVAIATAGVALAVAALNLFLALGRPPGEAIGGGPTLAIVLVQSVVACAALLVLGKTAKLGTIWGNLAAVAAMLVAVSGILLAAALWSVA